MLQREIMEEAVKINTKYAIKGKTKIINKAGTCKTIT
jgi:hypothetical protein